MKVLRAKEGCAYSIRLDFETREQLKHLRLFIATKMDTQVSDSVLIRRAIHLLTTEYDKLIRSTWITGKEQMINDEKRKLVSASDGSRWQRKLRPVDVLKDKFPTYRQRYEQRSKHFKENFIDELEAQWRSRTWK